MWDWLAFDVGLRSAYNRVGGGEGVEMARGLFHIGRERLVHVTDRNWGCDWKIKYRMNRKEKKTRREIFILSRSEGRTSVCEYRVTMSLRYSQCTSETCSEHHELHFTFEYIFWRSEENEVNHWSCCSLTHASPSITTSRSLYQHKPVHSRKHLQILSLCVELLHVFWTRQSWVGVDLDEEEIPTPTPSGSCEQFLRELFF